MESKETCPNLQVICQDLENYGNRTKQAIMDYRHRIGTCYTDCGGIHKSCKETIKYFLDKSGVIIEIKE